MPFTKPKSLVEIDDESGAARAQMTEALDAI
jgi:hypothetical protein